jgi:hypothetical protein
MRQRHPGHGFRWEDAVAEGLLRILKVPKGRKAKVAFIFGLIRRIYKAAPFITARDDEMAGVVLESLDFSRAARNLRPDRPASMRSRISTRYLHFQSLCEFFLSGVPDRSNFRLRGKRPPPKRLHSRTILRGPNGHLEPSRPKFVCLKGHTSPISVRTTLSRPSAPLALIDPERGAQQ